MILSIIVLVLGTALLYLFTGGGTLVDCADIVVGLALLVTGGNNVVSGASNIARGMGVSELVVGLTVVSVGTSAPELVVSIMAALEGHSAIALGNVVGSNNFNLLVVLALSAVLSPIAVGRSEFRRDMPFMLLCSVLMALFCNDFFTQGGSADGGLGLSRLEGGIFLALLIGYVGLLIWKARQEDSTADAQGGADLSVGMSVLLLALGIAALVVGGKLVLRGAVDVATSLGMSERVIGLTIVAAGTSLPELVTSLVACRGGHSDLAVGNALGSNIFNVLLILGVSSLICPMPYDITMNRDLVLMVGTSLLAFGMIAFSRKHIMRRWHGLVLFVIYIAYMGSLIMS